jgi:hypothetical protein
LARDATQLLSARLAETRGRVVPISRIASGTSVVHANTSDASVISGTELLGSTHCTQTSSVGVESVVASYASIFTVVNARTRGIIDGISAVNLSQASLAKSVGGVQGVTIGASRASGNRTGKTGNSVVRSSTVGLSGADSAESRGNFVGTSDASGTRLLVVGRADARSGGGRTSSGTKSLSGTLLASEGRIVVITSVTNLTIVNTSVTHGGIIGGAVRLRSTSSSWDT